MRLALTVLWLLLSLNALAAPVWETCLAQLAEAHRRRPDYVLRLDVVGEDHDHPAHVQFKLQSVNEALQERQMLLGLEGATFGEPILFPAYQLQLGGTSWVFGLEADALNSVATLLTLFSAAKTAHRIVNSTADQALQKEFGEIYFTQFQTFLTYSPRSAFTREQWKAYAQSPGLEGSALCEKIGRAIHSQPVDLRGLDHRQFLNHWGNFLFFMADSPDLPFATERRSELRSLIRKVHASGSHVNVVENIGNGPERNLALSENIARIIERGAAEEKNVRVIVGVRHLDHVTPLLEANLGPGAPNLMIQSRKLPK